MASWPGACILALSATVSRQAILGMSQIAYDALQAGAPRSSLDPAGNDLSLLAVLASANSCSAVGNLFSVTAIVGAVYLSRVCCCFVSRRITTQMRLVNEHGTLIATAAASFVVS